MTKPPKLFASQIGRRLLKLVFSFGLLFMLLFAFLQFGLEYRQVMDEAEAVFDEVAQILTSSKA